MSSRVILRRSADVLRKSYLKGAVGTPQSTALDAGGPSMLIRSQFDPSLEINYVDDPRLAVGETFTRATIRTTRDFEGRILTLNSGEVGFWGFRRVENLFDFTENFTNAYWAVTNLTVQGNVGAPPGLNNSPKADKLVETAANAAHSIAPAAAATVAGHKYVVSFRVRAAERSLAYLAVVNLASSTAYFDLANCTAGTKGTSVEESGIVPAGDGFVRIWMRYAATATNQVPFLGVTTADGTTSYLGTLGSGIFARQCQWQDVSGQNYLGPAEYVSRRILPAPYHGANVDGVKYFPTDAFGTVIKRYTGDTIKYLQITGTGGFASTPNAAANRVTGDLDLRVQLNGPVGSAGAKVLLQKDDVVNQRSYALQIGSAGAGKPRFFYSPDGVTTAGRIADSSVVISTNGIVDGMTFWLRVTYQANSGTVNFYTSLDGLTWTQLGATILLTAGAPFAGSAVLSVGASQSGTFPIVGVLQRAQVRSGINGPVVVDFNPNDASAAGAASLVSSTTGETWTINGNGTSSRINTFTYTGRRGLFRERAAANLQIRSDDASDATYTKTRSTVSSNAIIGVDGALLGDKLVEDATAGATHILQNTALVKAASALPYTLTYYLRAGERSAARADLFSGANGAFARFNLLDGSVLTAGTLVGAGFASPSAAIEQVSPGVYACSLTVTSDATAALQSQLGLYNAADAYNGDNASGLFLLAQQLEQTDHATSYIPTAAATVTRNADSNVGPSFAGAWFNSAAGTWYVEAMANYLDAGSSRLICSDAASGKGPVLVSATGNASANDGALLSTANAVAAGTLMKIATRYTTGTGKNITLNNGVEAGDASAAFPWTTFDIGQVPASTQYDGCIGRIWFVPQNLTARAKALTATPGPYGF